MKCPFCMSPSEEQMWEWQQDFPQWNPPALVQNKAFLSALCFFLYSHGAQTDYTRGLSSRPLKFQDISSSLLDWKYTPGPSWSFPFSLCPHLSQTKHFFMSGEDSRKTQVVWRVSGVNSDKHPNNGETSLKPWSHLNSAQKVNPGNYSSESCGKKLQAALSSCQHQW